MSDPKDEDAAPTSEPTEPAETTEDQREPPDGYEVVGSHGCLNWSMKAKFPRPIDLARAEAVATCWAHRDRITAPLRARLAEVERERDSASMRARFLAEDQDGRATIGELQDDLADAEAALATARADAERLRTRLEHARMVLNYVAGDQRGRNVLAMINIDEAVATLAVDERAARHKLDAKGNDV